jgi:tetratricopeptide (TPR) repeat protein
MSKITLAIALWFSISHSFAQEKPRKPYQLYEAAETSYNAGKYNEAHDLLNSCLAVDAGYMDAYALRAAVREQLKDQDGALTDYNIYLEKITNNPDVLLSRAVLRFNIGFLEQSQEDFRRMLTMNSSETNAIFFRKNVTLGDKNAMITTTDQTHHATVYNYLGLIESRQKNPRIAIAYLDTAIRLDSREADFYVNRGLAKEAIDDSTAFVDYETALRLNPDHVLAKHNLEALNARKLKNISAEERLTRTIQADSTMLYPYLERAQQRYEAGYFKGALEDYNLAIELDPQNTEILFARGLTKEKLKDYQGAFSDYTKAIDLKENFAKAWLSRGNVLLKLERYDDAIEDYNVAIVYYSDYSLAFFNRGMAKVKLKKNGEACADFKHAEELGMKVDEKIKRKVCEK